MADKFEQKYFVGQTDSNYVDYRLKKFDGLAQDLVEELPIRPMDRVIDIGCATGGLMYSLKRQGIHCVKGMDMSIWAIQYGRETFGFSPEDLQYYSLNLVGEPKDYAISLDVLEHCPPGELERIVGLLDKHPPRKGLVVRIPVSAKEGEDFVLDVSKNDRTHIQIHSKDWWKTFFNDNNFDEAKRIVKTTIYDSPGVYCAMFTHASQRKVEIRL